MADCTMTDDDDVLSITDSFKPVDEILTEAGIRGGGPTKWGSSFWRRAKLCTYDGLCLHRDGYEPARSEGLNVGTIFHVSIAEWERSFDRARAFAPSNVVMDWCRAELAKGPAQWPSELFHFAAFAQRLVVAYLGQYGEAATTSITLAELEQRDPPHEDVLLVEYPVLIEPPRSAFPLSTCIDLVFRVKDAEGQPAVVVADHKTTRHETPEWLEAWYQDDQMMGLFYLWKKVFEPLGWPPIAAVCVNSIEKPRGRNDEPSFRRHLFPFRPDRLSVWERQMTFAWQHFEHYQEIADKQGIYWWLVPQNWAACFGRRYSVCPRLDHCITTRDMTVYHSRRGPTAEQTAWWEGFCKAFGKTVDEEPLRICRQTWIELTPEDAGKLVEMAKEAVATVASMVREDSARERAPVARATLKEPSAVDVVAVGQPAPSPPVVKPLAPSSESQYPETTSAIAAPQPAPAVSADTPPAVPVTPAAAPTPPPEDVVQLAAPSVFDEVMDEAARLSGGATDALRKWLSTASEPALREYAARFPGQGERFHVIKDVVGLRAEIAKVTLEDFQAKLRGTTSELALTPPATLADTIAQVQACKTWKVIGFEPKAQTTVAEATTGRWYLVRGLIAMASPERTETARMFVLDTGAALEVSFKKGGGVDAVDMQAVPASVVRDDLGLATPPVATKLSAVEQAAEQGLPRKVGETAKPTGVVPVYWLGHHTRQQKAKDIFQSISKEGDAYGLALVGKKPETEKLKAWTFVEGVAAESSAKTVGSAGWAHFGSLIAGL